MDCSKYEKIATKIRIDIMDMLHEAGSGHSGGSLSCADILTALYFKEMNIDPKNPDMPGRDKLIMSKGHAAPAQYACLAERGFYPVEDLLTLRKMGSPFQGHSCMQKCKGIEMSTGSLGQGTSAAVGMALAYKMDEREGKPNGRVYAVLGDGELQEGLIWEAAMSAGYYKLDNLCLIIDNNGLQIDGPNDKVMAVKPIEEKFKAFGFNTITCDGHKMCEIIDALSEAKKVKGKPTVIVAHTVKGKGVSFMENDPGWHGKTPNDEEYKKALEELGGAR